MESPTDEPSGITARYPMTLNAAHSARRSRLRRALPVGFYDRPTEIVARELLGAVIECHTAAGIARGRIVETEAYIGEHDAACHAAAGLTPRTEPLYGPAGIAYVYRIYGMHWCVNAVTRARGLPSAVLIRALEPLDGVDLMWARRPRARRERDLTDGPGKLCAALGISAEHNRVPLQRLPLVVREGRAVLDAEVVVTPRIGVTRAAHWPLRYFVRGSPFVSRTPSGFERLPYARAAAPG